MASAVRRLGTEHGSGVRQRGSVLLLVPAAVLVLIILGAIAVDSAIAFLGQRELSGVAAAAANDAATEALSDERFYRGTGGADAGRIEIEPEAARRLALQAVALRGLRGVTNVQVETRTSGRQVCVILRGEVSHVFARAIPGAARSTTVEGRAVATAVAGPAGTTVSERATSC